MTDVLSFSKRENILKTNTKQAKKFFNMSCNEERREREEKPVSGRLVNDAQRERL